AQFESAKAHYKWGDGPLVTTDKKCLSHYSRLGEAARAHHRWCGVDRGVDARLRRVGAQECPMLAKLSLIVAGDVAGHPLMRQRSRLLCSVCARTRACGDTGDNVMPGRFGAAPARRPGIGIFAPGSQPAPLLPRRNEGGITLRASWRRRS